MAKFGIHAAWAGLWLGLAALGVAGDSRAASSCSTPDAGTPITTCYFDLTAAPSTTQSPASAVLDNGIFRVPDPNSSLGQGMIVGTGVFQPFVRIEEQGNGHADGIESGFNTDANASVLDDLNKGDSNWNHSLKLSDIPTITVCDGGGTTGTNCKQYYEFLLDLNEQGNSKNSGLSLDQFKVYTAGSASLTGSSATGQCAPDSSNGGSFNLCGATKVYDMDASPGGDASLLMDYNNFSGSGNGVDLQALVPVANFAGATASSYVYLYSTFGSTGGTCQKNATNAPCQTPGGPLSSTAGSLDYSADAGFEEWSVRKLARVSLPPTLLMLGLGLVLVGLQRRTSAAAA